MHSISVSVVYATPEKQLIKERQIPRGTSALELVTLSGIMKEFDELQSSSLDDLELGVFAQRVSHDYLLEDGDRVEIYRNLKADPKEVRRQLAKLGKTMGKK